MADPISIDLDALPNITKFEQEKLGDKYGLLTEIADRIGSLAAGGALSSDERNVKLFQEVMNRQEGYHLPVNGDVLDLATQEAYGKAKAEYDLNGIKDIYQQQAMRDYAYGKQGIEAGLAALTTPPHELNVELTRAFQKKWNSDPLRTAQKDFKPLEENGRMDPATQSAVQQVEEEKNKGQQHSSIKDLQGIKEALAPHWQEPKDTEISLAHSGVKSSEKIQLS